MRRCAVRRKIVSIAAIAAVAIPLSAAPRLAFQVYAVRDLCEKDFAGILKAAKAMRQVTATPRFSRRVLQELDCGNCVLGGGDPLACIAAHPRRNPNVHVMPDSLADLKASIEYLKRLQSMK